MSDKIQNGTLAIHFFTLLFSIPLMSSSFFFFFCNKEVILIQNRGKMLLKTYREQSLTVGTRCQRGGVYLNSKVGYFEINISNRESTNNLPHSETVKLIL